MFQRKRISLQCDVALIQREASLFYDIMPKFIQKQGETLQMLVDMRDFNLYALQPIYGEATFGFAKAFLIGGEKMNMLIPRVSDNGHK